MATVRLEFEIAASAQQVWSVVREFSTGPALMAPGYVTDCRLDGDGVRVVTFTNGVVARERLVTVDDAERRLTYSVIGGSVRPEHDNASMHILEERPGVTRFVWMRDLLPDTLADRIRVAMASGVDVMKSALARPAPAGGAGEQGD